MRLVRVAVRGAALAAHLLLAAAALPYLRRAGGALSGGMTLDERFMLWWNRRACRVLGLRVRRSGALPLGPALIVSNHVSWLEVIALGSVLPASFVAKSDVASWPGIGAIAEGAGTLFLKRGSGRAAARAAADAAARLGSGRSVALFPEGTSTSGEAVLPFHAALFEAAARVGCPVQPVSVFYPRGWGCDPVAPFIGDDDFASHLLRVLGEPEIIVQLGFRAPLEAHGREREELRDDARAAVVAGLAEDRRGLCLLLHEPADAWESPALAGFLRDEYRRTAVPAG
ncbi:MAG: 1-acyl-sn-glycerol-3-phosphate acyltransferase [Elusimicrobiota bacterium]|nr:MAG: 1-acyl-sn-glycerol-3-phosphate acyltransferase [Elusimicrobiota bacterium]